MDANLVYANVSSSIDLYPKFQSTETRQRVYFHRIQLNQLPPLRAKMDPPPPSLFVSFSDSLETRICGRSACGKSYRSCTPEEQAKWEVVLNSRNTLGDAIRWVCGPCHVHYISKPTTHRRGM
jgi:hypothetical protein